MKTKFKSIAHAKTSIRYHIIFSTKYRRKCLNEIKESVLNTFDEIQNVSDFKIIEMNLDGDHIHFLITFKPSLSIVSVVRRMKQLSTHKIWKNNETHLRKFYWGKKKILWSGGYFVSTIGNISEKNVIEYIKNQ